MLDFSENAFGTADTIKFEYHVVLFEDAITWIKQSDHNALLHGSIEARYNNQPR